MWYSQGFVQGCDPSDLSEQALRGRQPRVQGFAAPTATKETITQKSEIAGYANAFTSATSTKGIATLDLKRGCYRVAIPSGAGNPGCKGLQPRPKA
jgi:hypothetical protein